MTDKQDDPFDFIMTRSKELAQGYDDALITPEMRRKQEIEEKEESRQYFENTIKKRKQTETELQRYCREIREEVPDWDLTFEEYYKEEKEWQRIKSKRFDAEQQKDRELDDSNKPKGITDKEWKKQKKRLRKVRREENKQRELDYRLRTHSTPWAMLLDQIVTIHCRCEAQGIRQGHFCDTCKLLVKVNEQLIRLFKDSAQGRI